MGSDSAAPAVGRADTESDPFISFGKALYAASGCLIESIAAYTDPDVVGSLLDM